MDLSRPSSLPSRSQVRFHLPFDSLASVARLSPLFPFTRLRVTDRLRDQWGLTQAEGAQGEGRPVGLFLRLVASILARGRLSGCCSGQNQTVDILLPFPLLRCSPLVVDEPSSSGRRLNAKNSFRSFMSRAGQRERERERGEHDSAEKYYLPLLARRLSVPW